MVYWGCLEVAVVQLAGLLRLLKYNGLPTPALLLVLSLPPHLPCPGGATGIYHILPYAAGEIPNLHGDRIIHARPVINIMIVIISSFPCGIHKILHGGDINPNLASSRMMGVKKVIWILWLDALGMHCCRCRCSLGSDFRGQTLSMESLLQMLAAATATGHGISHMLAWVIEIWRLKECILIHEPYICHVFDMGVALNEVVQYFFLCIKPSVVVDWDSFIQFLNMPIIVMSIKIPAKLMPLFKMRRA